MRTLGAKNAHEQSKDLKRNFTPTLLNLSAVELEKEKKALTANHVPSNSNYIISIFFTSTLRDACQRPSWVGHERGLGHRYVSPMNVVGPYANFVQPASSVHPSFASMCWCECFPVARASRLPTVVTSCRLHYVSARV